MCMCVFIFKNQMNIVYLNKMRILMKLFVIYYGQFCILDDDRNMVYLKNSFKNEFFIYI